MTEAEKLRAVLTDSAVEEDFWLGGETTYRAGGRAAFHIRLNSFQDFEALVKLMPKMSLPLLVFGKGSNLLVADRGFPGVAVSLGTEFEEIKIAGTQLTAGGAALMPVVSRKAAKAGLEGFEWAVGVPGTVGGAVRMNAGGHGSDMAGCLKSVEIGDFQTGQTAKKLAEELGLEYRKSLVAEHQLVAAAVLELKPGDKKRSAKKISEIVKWRRKNQPGGQNTGSVFKNPSNVSAGEILDRAGAKKMRCGTARVSEKHANFIQVDPNGSADDVYQLMAQLQELVFKDCGVQLEPETVMVNF